MALWYKCDVEWWICVSECHGIISTKPARRQQAVKFSTRWRLFSTRGTWTGLCEQPRPRTNKAHDNNSRSSRIFSTSSDQQIFHSHLKRSLTKMKMSKMPGISEITKERLVAIFGLGNGKEGAIVWSDLSISSLGLNLGTLRRGMAIKSE